MVDIEGKTLALITSISKKWGIDETFIIASLNEHLPSWQSVESNVANAALNVWDVKGKPPWEYLVAADIMLSEEFQSKDEIQGINYQSSVPQNENGL